MNSDHFRVHLCVGLYHFDIIKPKVSQDLKNVSTNGFSHQVPHGLVYLRKITVSPEMTDHMMMTLSIFCGNLKCPSWTNKLFGNHNINLEINSEKFLELFDVSQHQGIQAQEPVLGSVVTVWSWYGAVRSVRESLTATIS